MTLPLDATPFTPRRRTVVGGLAALSAATALGLADTSTAHAASVRTDPFALGVASGDPLPDGLLLWTRLVKDPLDATSMPKTPRQATT